MHATPNRMVPLLISPAPLGGRLGRESASFHQPLTVRATDLQRRPRTVSHEGASGARSSASSLTFQQVGPGRQLRGWLSPDPESWDFTPSTSLFICVVGRLPFRGPTTLCVFRGRATLPFSFPSFWPIVARAWVRRLKLWMSSRCSGDQVYSPQSPQGRRAPGAV